MAISYSSFGIQLKHHYFKEDSSDTTSSNPCSPPSTLLFLSQVVTLFNYLRDYLFNVFIPH